MGWTSLLMTIWYGAGAAALAAVAYFAAAGEPTDVDFLLARLAWSILISLVASYLFYAVYQIDGPWGPKAGAAAFIGAVLASVLFGGFWYVERREIHLTTILYPGDSSTPAIPPRCKPPTKAIVVSAGTNIAWSTKNSFALLKMDGETSIGVARDESGVLQIKTLMVRDLDGTAIATKDDANPIWLAPSVRRKRPDKSTLIVFNRYGDKALLVRYLNPNAIEISGDFYGRRGSWVKIGDTDMNIMTNHFIGSCFGMQGGGTAIQIGATGPAGR